MDEHQIDCWILTSREYADDSVVMTMLPADWFSSRRRTILVFLRTSARIERFAVARYATDGLFPISWNPETEPDQWRALGSLLEEHQPATIALNRSTDFAHADGLTATEHEAMTASLGPALASRIVETDQLAVNWLETRVPEEKSVMELACGEAHALLRRALSREIVEPGETTTEDVVWWLRDRVQEHGAGSWFQPTVSVQRAGGDLRGSFATRPGSPVIEPEDLIHIDFGIVWDGLCTDQQQHGWVLAPGETQAPDWVNEALSLGNQAQDILMSNFAVDLTGNEVLERALGDAAATGIAATIYTHPIGLQGHGAGPTIGLWDHQGGVPGSGDRLLRANTAWSIELMAEVAVADWGDQILRIMLEEDAWFDGSTVEFLDGRQTDIWVI
jgi:Xaa-Pro aminopeptidase